jgi:putative Holliday junction resolvase
MSEAHATVLGFDFGEKRIGIAVGQTVTRTADPLQSIGHQRQQPDWDAITRLIDTWAPNALVVGIPINMDGTEHRLASQVMRFCRQLHGRYHLPVHTFDERLSSFEAEKRLVELRTASTDALAAQVILESWLSQP